MGLFVSLAIPSYINANNINRTNEKNLKDKGALHDQTLGITRGDTYTTEDDGIKYLSKHGPPTLLGPTPGNVPEKNKIPTLPDIKPPQDVTGKVDPDLSTYDTIQMTPDVDWEKKKNKAAKN